MNGVTQPKSLNAKRPKQKPKPCGPETLDIVFEEISPGKRGKGAPRSLSKVHIARTFSDALALKPKAVRLVLNMIKANDKAMREALARMPRERDDDFNDAEFSDPGNANRALVILSIALVKKRHSSDSPAQLMLEPWVVEAGLKRYGKRYMHKADRAVIERHTRKSEDLFEDWDAWPSLPETLVKRPARPKGPSFEEQKFKPGQSGNSRGRPPAPKWDVPYPFLIVMGTVSIDGQHRRLTRAQAFIRKLSTATFPSDSSLPDTIAKMMIDTTLERWKRPPVELPIIGKRTPGRLDFAACMELIFLARKLNRMRECRRIVIEPWLVEMALHELRDEPPLSLIEQQIVVEATRTPWKVKWPGYWEATIPQRRGKAID